MSADAASAALPPCTVASGSDAAPVAEAVERACAPVQAAASEAAAGEVAVVAGRSPLPPQTEQPTSGGGGGGAAELAAPSVWLPLDRFFRCGTCGNRSEAMTINGNQRYSQWESMAVDGK